MVLGAKPGQSSALTAAFPGMIGLFASALGHVHAGGAVDNAAGYLAGFLIATAALILMAG